MRKSELKKLYAASKNNGSLINKATTVGCFSCCNTYAAQDVTAATGANQTVQCPLCTIDAVIPMDDISERKRVDILNRLFHKYYMP